METVIRYRKPGNNNYANYRPKLCWCGQPQNTTHSCISGLPVTEIYEYKSSEITL